MLPYYYSVSEYLKDTYGKKLYKLSLSGNMAAAEYTASCTESSISVRTGHVSGKT